VADHYCGPVAGTAVNKVIDHRVEVYRRGAQCRWHGLRSFSCFGLTRMPPFGPTVRSLVTLPSLVGKGSGITITPAVAGGFVVWWVCIPTHRPTVCANFFFRCSLEPCPRCNLKHSSNTIIVLPLTRIFILFCPLPFLLQVLVASAWAINMRATYAAGRLDGRSRASGPRPVRFFTPASWAFAIWAPIFAGELRCRCHSTASGSDFAVKGGGDGLAPQILRLDSTKL